MKISNGIEKMKRSYRHMAFFDRLAKDVKSQIQNVIVDQNKWLKVLQDDNHQAMTSYDAATEHQKAEFYTDNYNWIMGEVKNYIQVNQEEKDLAIQK